MPLTFKVAIRTIVVPVQRTSEARPSYYYGAIGYQWSYCSSLPGARQAYLDRELCGVRPDGITSFSLIQMASDAGNAAGLVFFLFDLLHLDGEDLTARALTERKTRLAELLARANSSMHYSDHQIGLGPAFYKKACALSVEGIVSKRADAAYAPGNRGLWLKVKCLNREEFVVIGWTDPEGSRPHLGALL